MSMVLLMPYMWVQLLLICHRCVHVGVMCIVSMSQDMLSPCLPCTMTPKNDFRSKDTDK
jgi:hypothetical protein